MLKSLSSRMTRLMGSAALVAGAAVIAFAPQAEAKVRVAYGDIASVENLHLLAAFELA